MPQKSLSLLERKRLQWEKEKEELIGLCSPWGRPPSLKKLSTSCTSLTEGIKNLSTNLGKYGNTTSTQGNKYRNILDSSSPAIVTSTYLKDLGLLSSSQSECHLPPIGLEKQKVHDPDGFRDLNLNTTATAPFNGNTSEIQYWFNRKRSLPSCILTPNSEGLGYNTQSRNFGQQEVIYRNNGNVVYHANDRNMNTVLSQYETKGQRHLQIQNLQKRDELDRISSEKWKSFQLQQHQEEDPHTSGYQSENNPFHSDGGGSDNSRNGTGDSEYQLSLHKRYFSNPIHNIQPEAMKSMPVRQDSYVYTSEVDVDYYKRNQTGDNRWTKPGSYLYSKRNEMDHYEIQRSENNNRQVMTKSSEAESLQQKTWSYVNSRVHIPPPAMRSSFTTSLDAPDKDAYQDLKKQEHDKWLRDLEQQRDEQRLRKQLEKDEKAGRWGDRGVVVGHLWEPASVPDSRLPAREEHDANFSRIHHGATGTDGSSGRESYPPRWSEHTHSLQMDEVDYGERNGDNRINSDVSRSTFQQKNPNAEGTGMSEHEQKIQKALQHQETLRKQMEERQQRLKEAQEKRIEEEKAEEAKFLAYRLEQLKKLELEQRQELIKEQESAEPLQNDPDTGDKFSERGRSNLFASKNRGDIEAFHRQLEIENSYLLRKNLASSFTLPPINPLQSPATATSSPYRHRSMSPFEEYEATVMKEEYFRTTETQNENSGIQMQEFGTQTDVSDTGAEPSVSHTGSEPITNTVQDNPSGSVDAEGDSSGKNKKITKKKERPKWGIPQPTKQYLKQSEKDPHYQHRLQRRLDRQKRRQNQLKLKAAILDEKTMPGSEGAQIQKPKASKSSTTTKRPRSKKPATKDLQRDITNNQRQQNADLDDHGVQKDLEEFKIPPYINDLEVDSIARYYNSMTEIVYSAQVQAEPAFKEEISNKEPEADLSNPSIHSDLVQNDNDRDTNHETGNHYRTNSPPVPALMKKLEESVNPGGANHSEPQQPNSDFNIPNNDEDATSLSGTKSNVATYKEQPEPPSSEEFENSEPDQNVVKMSPATLVIESTADYFSSPDYYPGRVNSGDSLPDYRNVTVVPVSPPTHLKNLIYGIQNLGTYLPVSPTGTNGSEKQNLTSELTKGPLRNRTIEFTIKFPAEYYKQDVQSPILLHHGSEDEEWRNIQNLKRNTKNHNAGIEPEYLDPFLEEKKKTTIDWLHSSKSSSREDSAMARLVAMRNGIRIQQEEWGVVPSDSEIEGSFYASSFYPSSERSSSSN